MLQNESTASCQYSQPTLSRQLPDMATVNLSKISDREILLRLTQLIQNERKLSHLILWHLNEVDIRRLYFQVGCSSFFEYLTKHCGYSDSAAYERQNATRLLRKIPEITNKLADGEINLSQLAKIESKLKENKTRGLITNQTEEKAKALDVIEQVQNLNLSETAQVLAKEFDSPVKKVQRQTPQRDESVRLQFTLTKEQHELFKLAQSLISHCVPNRDLADTVTYLSKVIIKKKLGKDAQILKGSVK